MIYRIVYEIVERNEFSSSPNEIGSRVVRLPIREVK
jgi:hypothetical protein